jgi:DNA/RNA endonuclease G (NUC1)
VATLKFELIGGGTVYLDNVFFKSQHLLFGNPTDARQVLTPNTNFLLEKPQFVVSYNDSTKTANWVSWQLNKSWLPVQTGIDRIFDFSGDSTLPPEWYSVPNSALTRTGFERGHIAPNADRNRNSKDEKATFVTTNLLPQHPATNDSDSPWNAFERYLRNTLVKSEEKELQIISGGYGNQGTIPLPADNLSNTTEKFIKIPEYLWKVVLVTNPGQVAADVRNDAEVIAIMIPNRETPNSFPYNMTLPTGKVVNIANVNQWEDWQTWRVNGNDLEVLLSRQQGSTFDFFSNVQSDVQEVIERAGVAPTLAVPLLAETSPDDQLLFFIEGQIRNNRISENSTVYSNIEPSSITQISSGKVSIDEMSFTGIGPSQISITQVGIIKSTSSDMGFTQIGTTQVGLTKTSSIHISPGQISTTQISIGQTSVVEPSLAQIGVTQIGVSKQGIIESSPGQISTTQVGTIQIGTTQVSFGQIYPGQIGTAEVIATMHQSGSSKASFTSGIMLQQFFSSHNYDLQNTTVPTWTQFIQGTTPFNLNIEITDLPTGQLAEASLTGYDSFGRPNSGTLTLDLDGNGLGWFIDTTPWENSEFGIQTSDYTSTATPGSLAYGRYDLLTTILHELGHLQGMISGNPAFDQYLQRNGNTLRFIAPGINAQLTPDGSHLDSSAHPNSLMNTTLRPGMRKLPTALDLAILNAIWGAELTVQNSASNLSAPLTAGALIGINNGNFDTSTNWSIRGDSQILNGHAILSEDSPYQSNFSQTFVVPQGAKALQFTLLSTDLNRSSLTPGDTFEAALLDTRTGNSVINFAAGLSNTDAFLNLQHNGQVYFGDAVKLVGATSSGDTLALNAPRTVQVDLSGITPGTVVTLYLDLLGFDDLDGDTLNLSDDAFIYAAKGFTINGNPTNAACPTRYCRKHHPRCQWQTYLFSCPTPSPFPPVTPSPTVPLTNSLTSIHPRRFPSRRSTSPPFQI